MSENQENHDWKAIATELARGLNFAITHMKPPSSSAGIMDMKTGSFTPYREYLVECFEKYPGVKIDREMLALCELPPAKRRKALKELQDRRAAEAEKAKGGV